MHASLKMRQLLFSNEKGIVCRLQHQPGSLHHGLKMLPAGAPLAEWAAPLPPSGCAGLPMPSGQEL